MDREIGKTNKAMGHLTSLADLPDGQTLLRYLKTAASLYDAGVPSRSAPKPKPALKTPPDLARALKRIGKATRTWGELSASHRREHIEWLLEAKRAETRAKRLATTLEWLAAGKSLNWKYQKSGKTKSYRFSSSAS